MSTKQTPVYQQTYDQVFRRFDSVPRGLRQAEAARRLAQFGPNALTGMKQEPAWRKYIRQFKDWMVLLLVISAGLSLYLGDYRTSAVLFVLIVFNTTIGFIQEYRAEKTMQALEKLILPSANVYRNGLLTQVDSRELVPGDVVRIAEGENIPADLRIYKESALATNDFALTGESNPSRKFTHSIGGVVPLGNRHNLAFMGTTVAIGEAEGIVVATGMNTELGRIAELSQEAHDEPSPLQKEIRHIATMVTYAVMLLSVVLIVVAIKANLPFKDAILFAIGVASSLIPQGLPAEVNTSLAQAAGKLAKARALVKKLSAVETLGATSVICTDKTGTLTKNQMTVESFVTGNKTYEVSGVGYQPVGEITTKGKGASKAELKKFIEIGVYASNARLVAPHDDEPEWVCLGDPTEGALLTLAHKAGIDIEACVATPEVREYPFDSGRKRMTSVRTIDGKNIAFVKGAPENVLERCTHIRVGGKTRKLTAKDREQILAEHTERAGQALRNLAYATRDVNTLDIKKTSYDTIESKLIYQGMVSMRDPLRESVKRAMTITRKAHVKINIVTGDFALTAEALARQAGLIAKDEKARIVSGEEIEDMSDEDVLAAALGGSTIFSRVSPEDKMRIVTLVKKHGDVVAVTGDGINDAPALKHANIGVAMGITGTDVAKQASEVVLLDDSFASLVGAIRQGRTIFANIKKGVLSCFTSNFAEMVINLTSLTLTSLFGLPIAMNILQLLAIDLLAELFPIAALGWDKEDGETMREHPRNPRDHILSRENVIDLITSGVLIGSVAIFNFVFVIIREGHGLDHPALSPELIARATTVTYVTVVTCQLLNIIQRRTVHGFFSRYQLHNKVFWGSVILSAAIVLTIVYVPVVSTFFKSAPLHVSDWLYIALTAGAFLAVRELQRTTGFLMPGRHKRV